MENKAGFYLNKALQDWKAELASQPGISAENIRELETHLLESITAFRKSGCSEEDAFSKARQKLGPVPQLGAEFAKENLLKVWRDRVFWITVFPLLLTVIYFMTDPLFEKLAHALNASLGLSQSPVAYAFLAAIPTFLVATAMAAGFAEVLFRRLHWIFSDRWRFAATGLIAMLGATIMAVNNLKPETLVVVVIFGYGLLGFAVLIWPRELAIALPTIPLSSDHSRSSVALWRDRLFWAVLAYIPINMWNLVPAMGAHELIRLKGEKVLAHLWYPAGYLSLWLLPMAAVGLLLASAHLSALTRWLRTRLRVSLFTGALLLVWMGQMIWLWHWGIRPASYTAADWNLEFQRGFLHGTILLAGLIVIALWAMPSRVERQDGGDRFRLA
jgi:hypothetical protein